MPDLRHQSIWAMDCTAFLATIRCIDGGSGREFRFDNPDMNMVELFRKVPKYLHNRKIFGFKRFKMQVPYNKFNRSRG